MSAQSENIIPAGSGIVGVSTVVYPEGAKAEVTLGYWSIRGLAQAIRYVLAYAGVPFADTRYQQGGPPELSRAAWLDVKETLQLDFPNLPYLIEGNLRLTQSTTILRHLGRKYKLAGATLEEQARCDLVLDTSYDFKSVLVSTAYSRDRAAMLADFAAKTIPHYFSQFEALRTRAPSKWFAGDNLTLADFFMFEMLDQSNIMVPGCVDAYPHLRAFQAQFLELPQIQAYRKSKYFIERPINNMAGMQ